MSKVERPIGNKKGVSNWVEESGGLPKYIEEIAEHVPGKTDGERIAAAVNTVKRWAAGGTVRPGGGPKVTAKTQAKAAKALAEWNAKRAKARATNASVVVTNPSLNLAATTMLLSIRFDPGKHPRDFRGRFRDVVGGLRSGETVELPDGTRVTKEGGSYNVSRRGTSAGANIRDPEAAAREALSQSARSRDPKSVGGAGSYSNLDDLPEPGPDVPAIVNPGMTEEPDPEPLADELLDPVPEVTDEWEPMPDEPGLLATDARVSEAMEFLEGELEAFMEMGEPIDESYMTRDVPEILYDALDIQDDEGVTKVRGGLRFADGTEVAIDLDTYSVRRKEPT